MAEGPLPARDIVKRLMLERSRAAESISPPRNQPGDILTGRLEAHGSANYQFRSDGSPSYYVTISSVRGRETLWGVDLKRAIQQSKSQPKMGAMVGLQRVGSETVAMPASDGNRVVDRERTFRRTIWRVEAVEYLAQSIERSRREREAQLADQRALRDRPELRSAFVTTQIAQKFAETNIRDPRDRALFVERVKEMIALSVQGSAQAPQSRRTERERVPRAPGREGPVR